MAIFPTNHSPFYVSIYPLSPLFPANSRNSTPLLASLTMLVFVFAYFFKTSPVVLLHPFPLSASPVFHRQRSLSPFSSRVLADTDLANPRDGGGGERRGWRGIENGRFHTRGGEGRTKETEQQGNGETKRLKGNRTSKRSTKRKKARKGERSLCVCVCVGGGAGQYSHRIENWARDNKPGLLFGTASFPFR